MDDVRVELALDVDELGALEHAARLDLGAGRPGLRRSVGHLAAERLAGHGIRHEVGRARVEREAEAVGRLAARVEDRRVVAREHDVTVLRVADRLPHVEHLEELRGELLRVRRVHHEVAEGDDARGGLVVRADLLRGALVLEGEPLLARRLLEPADALVGGALEVERLARVGGGDIGHGVAGAQLDQGGAIGRLEGVAGDLLVGAASCQNDRRHGGDGGSAKHAAKERAIHHGRDCIGKIWDLPAQIDLSARQIRRAESLQRPPLGSGVYSMLRSQT